MAKFSEIKVGDIVCHDGRIARVMEKTNITMENPIPLSELLVPLLIVDYTLPMCN